MSTVAASSPAIAPIRRESPRRRLRAVPEPARKRRPRLVYGIVAVLGAFLIGAAQMSLSILTTQTSYEIVALAKQQSELTWQAQILYDEVAGLSSPQFLAANASALGMVIDESPSYLRLSDAAILGTGAAAAGASSIDAIGRGAVANSLITDTPLITDPDATIGGVPVAEPETDAEGGAVIDPNAPPPITDGLPTPSTH